jgi:DNA topoisomerase-3
MQKKLVIAEKASVGREIAAVLGCRNNKGSYIEGDRWIVSWCIGHLIRQLDPEEYGGLSPVWNMKELPVVPAEWRYAVKEDPKGDCKRQLRVLRDLINRDDVIGLVEATDAGREGELIFREVYDFLNCKKPFERLWVSSMEESAIREAFANLRPSSDFDGLHQAALSRQKADWLVGMNDTRFYTLLYKTRGLGTLSVGRVQTPTLKMIVDRQYEIDNFKPSTSFSVVRDFGKWSVETEEFPDKQSAERFVEAIKGKPLTIVSLETKRKKASPPKLYNLTDLQREANLRYGYTAEETLEFAQSLYMKKQLSYPRTDSRNITKDMEASTLSLMRRIAKAVVPEMPEPTSVKALVNDAGVTDHYALMITPYGLTAGSSNLSEGEQNIKRLVVVRMIESVMPWCEFDSTTLKATCGGKEFTGVGYRDVVRGWKDVRKSPKILAKAPELEAEDRKVNNEFPSDLAAGKSYTGGTTKVAPHTTRCPLNYTEDTLLGAMEKAGNEDMPDDAERTGIGTSATRAKIIEDLCKKGYVGKLSPDKGSKAKAPRLYATAKGKFLISVVGEKLKTPKTTADWEWRLKGIEKGKESADDFCSGITDEVRETIVIPEDYDPDAPVVNEGTDVGSCPFCGDRVVAGRTGYFCKKKGNGCTFALYTESKLYNRHKLTEDEVKKLLLGQEIPMKMYSEGKKVWYTCKVSLGKNGPDDKGRPKIVYGDFVNSNSWSKNKKS